MIRRTTIQALAIAGVMAISLPAVAGDFGLGFSFSKGRHGPRLGVGVAIGRPAVAPAPVVLPRPVVTPRVYVAPVYQMVTERVWVPTVQTLYRDVPVLDRFGRVISYRREPYTVSSGYWGEVQRRVLVREGYWTAAGTTDVNFCPAGPVEPYGNGSRAGQEGGWLRSYQPDGRNFGPQENDEYGAVDYQDPRTLRRSDQPRRVSGALPAAFQR